MPKIKILIDQEAKEVHDKIWAFIIKDKGNIPLLPISGYFRTDSYEWVVFKAFIRDKEYVFQHRCNVQHPGDCLRYLENDTIV